MKKTILCLMAIATMAACGHKADREEMIKDIEEQEQTIDLTFAEIDGVDSVLSDMIGRYRRFYTQFPGDSLTPMYMQRAADLEITLGQSDAAVALLDSIIKLHPDYDDVAGCWFLKGYAYECVENYDSARAVYTHFVDAYPEHPLAGDTRKTIQFLGLTPEEMFEAIMSGASSDNLVSD